MQASAGGGARASGLLPEPASTPVPGQISGQTPTPVFEWDDPFGLSDQLTDEERLIRRTVASYAREKLAPHVRQAFRDESFDPRILSELGALGLLGMTLSSHGCAGASHVAYGLAAAELEKIDSAYRSALSVQSSLVMFAIYAYGSAAQRDAYLPRLASGKSIGCFGLTESEAGSNPGEMRTKAVLQEAHDDWLLNGSKAWITHAPIADLFVIWARGSHDGVVRGFLLEKGTPGLETQTIEGKLSLRASVTGSLILRDVRVPAGQCLARASGLKAPLSCLTKARLGIAFGALGAAEACLSAARSYVLERHQFGRPLAQTQLVQKRLADMVTEIGLGQLANLRVARQMDRGRCPHELVSLVKRNSTRKALAVARRARDMLGANGIHEAYDVMRHLINLETVHTYEGTEDIHALLLGRAITGLPAF